VADPKEESVRPGLAEMLNKHAEIIKQFARSLLDSGGAGVRQTPVTSEPPFAETNRREPIEAGAARVGKTLQRRAARRMWQLQFEIQNGDPDKVEIGNSVAIAKFANV
jgi:hypothetical protein